MWTKFIPPKVPSKCAKPRDWEIRVDKENKLLDSLKVKEEPEDEDEEDFEAPSTSNKRKRVFTEESPENSERDSVFDSDEDFQVEKENPKNRSPNKILLFQKRPRPNMTFQKRPKPKPSLPLFPDKSFARGFDIVEILG